ncbi:MAG: hypothetical protein ACREMK_09625 [Gemmatimonadota bacterium]
MLVALSGCRSDPVVTTDPITPAAVTVIRVADLDSLANALGARADTLPIEALPALESEIREWLGRMEFGDPSLVSSSGTDARRALRPSRGRLLDALGWSSYRRGDLRQAEAALVSAVAEINSRGTTSGYALHFYHFGVLQAGRGRWGPAVEAFLDAEVRGMGAKATPDLEAAYRRLRGSLAGLDDRRARERARVEDERRQQLVTGALSQRLPALPYPTRAGPSFEGAALAGRHAVVAIWDADCSGCAGYEQRLASLAAGLRRRGGELVGVWLGVASSPPAPASSFPVLTPPDPVEARQRLGIEQLPSLLVVDERGWIRFRWSGAEATPPPSRDILVQVDHLRRRSAGVPESDRPAQGSRRREGS